MWVIKGCFNWFYRPGINGYWKRNFSMRLRISKRYWRSMGCSIEPKTKAPSERYVMKKARKTIRNQELRWMPSHRCRSGGSRKRSLWDSNGTRSSHRRWATVWAMLISVDWSTTITKIIKHKQYDVHWIIRQAQLANSKCCLARLTAWAAVCSLLCLTSPLRGAEEAKSPLGFFIRRTRTPLI